MFLMMEKSVVVFHQVAPLCMKHLMKVKSTDVIRTTQHLSVPQVMQNWFRHCKDVEVKHSGLVLGATLCSSHLIH